MQIRQRICQRNQLADFWFSDLQPSEPRGIRSNFRCLPLEYGASFEQPERTVNLGDVAVTLKLGGGVLPGMKPRPPPIAVQEMYQGLQTEASSWLWGKRQDSKTWGKCGSQEPSGFFGTPSSPGHPPMGRDSGFQLPSRCTQ